MSSHREAPEISYDPVADSTDVYAFVSPDRPNTVTLIANYVPLQKPDGGPNFYQFGNDVLYEIKIDNNGDGLPDTIYQFTFENPPVTAAAQSFLYNTGPISFSHGKYLNWNRPQTYTVTKVQYLGPDRMVSTKTLGSGLRCPPCNIGPLSTPDYLSLVDAAIFPLSGGSLVFAGQRNEGFYVDLGAIFDLGDLREFQPDHNTFGLANTGLMSGMPGINSTRALNVQTIAIQVPTNDLTAHGYIPTSPTASNAVIGIWTTASRQKVRMLGEHGMGDDDGRPNVTPMNTGPYVQVSRLGSPLFNELLVALADKDYWNSQPPDLDSQFIADVGNPVLAQLLPTLYPGVFPNLAAYNNAHGNSSAARPDLIAILLTGIPPGVIAPSFTTYTGKVQADMLRLNVAIPASAAPSNLGLLGGDIAGFPNGRRVFDDVATIELRAIAGATLPLVDKSFTPDKAAGEVSFGLTSGGATQDGADLRINDSEYYLPYFPYLGTPFSGYKTQPGTAAAS